MKQDPASTVGRPREFCTEDALSSALKVFWKKGFDGASLTDLTEAMGITRPSLYCAFGNKEELFKKALDLYEREKLAFIEYAMSAPTAYETVERMLLGGCKTYSNPDTPGCMSVNSVLSNKGVASDSIRQELANRRIDTEARLRERFDRAKAEGEIGDANPEALAGYVMTIAQGIALQAGMGVGPDMLKQIVDTALMCIPRKQRVAA